MHAATIERQDKPVFVTQAWITATLCVFPWFHGAELVWEQITLAALLLIPGILTLSRSKFWATLPGDASAFVVLFGLWLMYCVLYIIPLPLELISRLSEHTATWYQLTPVPELAYLSLYKHTSVIELIKYLALLSLFVSIFFVFCSVTAIRNLVYALIAGCSLTAVYSLINFVTQGRFEWVDAIPPWDLPWEQGIRGTFSYKNQYALYLVMTAALACGLFAEKITRLRHNEATITGWPQWLRRYCAPSVLLLGTAIILLYVTLLNTSSRGALASLIVATGTTLALQACQDKRTRRKLLSFRAAGTGALLIITAGAVFTQTSAFQRFSNDQLQDNGRTLLRQTASSVVADFPLVGTGPGTYPYIQHIYKPAELGNSAMSKRAHNDYLETLATHGVIGSLLLLSALALALYKVFKPVRGHNVGLLLGCRCALLAYIIQGAFDVNVSVFYLPAYFITILAVAWILALRQELPCGKAQVR